jgi:poly(3-hydroxybutyrate) depolymerase
VLAVVVVSALSCGKKEGPPRSDPPAPAAIAMLADGGAPRAAGCGNGASSPRALTMTTPGGRTFHVWGPASYDAARAYPVVFTYHGIQSDGLSFQRWFKMEEHVAGQAFVVYPDANGPTWKMGDDSDLAFFDAMRVALSNAFCIDLSRLYAFGFSYGGKFVHHLGCHRSSALRAISVGDGSWGRTDASQCKPLPVLVTHRTRDPDERFEWGTAARDHWTQINGCTNATKPIDEAHGCVTYEGCKATTTFCEDKWFDEKWPHDWNHTVREEYRDLTWGWLASQ